MSSFRRRTLLKALDENQREKASGAAYVLLTVTAVHDGTVKVRVSANRGKPGKPVA
jgi:hypothetical protein